jgi:serine protease inhibitor
MHACVILLYCYFSCCHLCVISLMLHCVLLIDSVKSNYRSIIKCRYLMGFVVFCQVSPIHVLFSPRSVFFAIAASLKTAIVTQQQVSTTVERVISLSIFSFTCYRHLYSKSILALVWVVSSLISY